MTNILLVELLGVIVAVNPVTTAPPDAWVVVVEKVFVLVTLTTCTTEFISAPSVPRHRLNFIVPIGYTTVHSEPSGTVMVTSSAKVIGPALIALVLAGTVKFAVTVLVFK